MTQVLKSSIKINFQINLAINSDEYSETSEVLITSNREGYSVLSGELNILNTETSFLLVDKENKFYKYPIKKLLCKLELNTNKFFNLCLENNCLILSNDKSAYLNLSETEKTDSSINTHFHIDYFEGNGILNKTNISLILQLVESF